MCIRDRGYIESVSASVASKLHSNDAPVGVIPQVRHTHQPPAPMARDLQTRFFAVILALLSVAAVVFAWINFQKEHEFSTPTDGVWWMESHGQLVAQRVDPLGPGDRGGIKAGDALMSVGGNLVHNNVDVARQMYRSGIWTKLSYTLE